MFPTPEIDFIDCWSGGHQSRISSELEWALSGTILLLVIGTSFVEIANVRNQIIENLDVPIFFLKKIPQHLSLSFKKYLNPKRIPKLLSFVEGLVLVHRRHKLAIMSGLDPDLTRLCYKGTARRQSPARKAFEK